MWKCMLRLQLTTLIFALYYLYSESYLRDFKAKRSLRSIVRVYGFSKPKEFCFFNTATKRKEVFQSIDPNQVKFYSCGPTVYDYAHIGNFRAFLTYDLVKRWLTYCGYDVNHICNLTDIDDKIILRMAKENKSLQEITSKYTSAFFNDLKALNIILANQYPKATDYIEDMEKMIEILLKKNHAYIENGSVYFKVSSFPGYGELSNIKFDDQVENSGGTGPNERRGESDKVDRRDFALWKAYTSNDRDVYFESSSLGRGRPGWHIECSAMAHRLLGESIDIHAGGVDLVFPHHSNEIAQSEAFTGKKFSRYWIHNGFVNIDNEKMSKSLQNFKTLRDIVKQPLDARVFRFLVITSQYRNPLNFNEESLKSSKNALKRIDKVIEELREKLLRTADDIEQTDIHNEHQEFIDGAMNEFHDAMSDDMNTPRATAALFKLVNLGEKITKIEKCTQSTRILYDAIMKMNEVFGIIYDVPQEYFQCMQSEVDFSMRSGSHCNCGNSHSDDLELEIKALAEERAVLKAAKRYQEADAIREKVRSMGYNIKDRKDGFDIVPLE